MFGKKSLKKALLIVIVTILATSVLACAKEETPVPDNTTVDPATNITNPPADTTTNNGDPAITGAWVGSIDGTDAFIAISSNGQQVIVFVCDGKSFSQWIEGPAANEINMAEGNVSFNATLTPESVTGVITLPNSAGFAFQGVPVSGDAGLYRLEETINGELWTSGWILLSDGQIRGLRVSASGAYTALSALTPGATKLDATTFPY